MRISVVICTHNARKAYFDRCLAALREQSLAPQEWDLIVIDNRSDTPVSSWIDLCWHPASRVVREEQLGLTPARLRGIAEAHGDVLVFVDDDNVLDRDYLAAAKRIAQDRPFLGSWSGQCRPGFESQPPDWTRRYWGNLVIRQFDSDVWSNLPRLAETMPCGAGLCVRRAVAQHYLTLNQGGKRKLQLDRRGGSLMSGGDNDLAACACALGLGVGLVADLRLTHLIPPERLTAEYLERLAEGIHFSSVVLDGEYGVRHPRRTLPGRIADQLRLLRLPQPHRRILKAAYRGRDRAIALVEKGLGA